MKTKCKKLIIAVCTTLSMAAQSFAVYYSDNFNGQDLSGRDFSGESFDYVIFRGADLSNANLSNTRHNNTFFDADTNLSGVRIEGMRLFLYSSGYYRLNAAQVESTWNYQNKDFTNVDTSYMDVAGMDFSDFEITGASLNGWTAEQFTSTKNWKSKDLYGVNWNYISDVTSLDFTGMLINYSTRSASSKGLSLAQLKTTQSWANKDLRGINLDLFQNSENNVAGLDFTGFLINDSTLFSTMTSVQIQSTKSWQDNNLSGVDFGKSNTSTLDFTGKNISNTVSSIAYSQLRSTQNWADNDLSNVRILTDVSEWNFTDKKINGSSFAGLTAAQIQTTSSWKSKDMSNFNFYNIVQTGLLDFTGQKIDGSRFNADRFTFAQLASTQSYKDGNLQGIHIGSQVMTGDAKNIQPTDTAGNWNFAGKDLTGATLERSRGINYTRANLTNANMSAAYNCDFRGAEMTNLYFSDNYTESITNCIFSDGRIKNISLRSSTGFIRVNDWSDIQAYIADDVTMTNKSRIEIAAGQSLLITDSKSVSVGANSKIRLEMEEDRGSKLTLDSGAALSFESGSLFEIDFGDYDPLGKTQHLLIDGDTVLASGWESVDYKVIFNGVDVSSDWSIRKLADGNIYLALVPEPSAYAAALGMLALALAAYRRRK